MTRSQHLPDNEPVFSICDRCSRELGEDEGQPGPPGEYEGCNLCEDCFNEEKEA